jgi:DNA repair exonuclease SbcCD ATPase subunit
MLRTDKVSKLRQQFVSELQNLETQLAQELDKVRGQLSTLTAESNPARRQSRTSTEAKSKTVSILSGKICPKCGKKGHDLRWHRWHDKKAAHNGRQRAS